MSKDDRRRADARPSKIASKAGKSDQEIAAQAVRDNMARLKALRLAREAAEPPQAAAKSTRGAASGIAKRRDKSKAKTAALSEWLAGQQSGGRRT